ncbi:hypothetical protein CBER1_09483 [Cercospora berteroae]|uniref:Major facilitator superfamily (MFS) profile domain-containing protein n=1 Tax=Cercospora berteroae TaxID=357750 RepID=A0A2S6CAH0_9PEZI|nr:hypothetical protein CBER1_09483 [Cercospora berteroae]
MEKAEHDIEAATYSTEEEEKKHERPASNTPTSPEDGSAASTREHIDIPPNVNQKLHSKGLATDNSGLVRWKSGTSAHPRRWPLFRKSYDSAVIICMEFVMTLFSNVGSSIVPDSIEQLGTSEELGLFYFTTLYLLGQALGGLIFPPLAESFGGRTIYTTCAFGFGAFCALVGASPTVPAVVVGRFVSGFVSAMPAVVACGSIENMWNIKARIWLVHIWIASAVLALALAPAIAVAVSESSLGWQWLFRIAAILGGLMGIACLFMQESRPSQLLRQKVQRVSRTTDFRKLSVDHQDSKPSFPTFVQKGLTMPLRLFFTEPIVFLTSIMAAIVYAVIYLFTAALPQVYEESFGYTRLQGSLVFVSIAVGICFTLLPRIYDIRVACRKDAQAIEPEDKLFGFYVAAPVLAVGLWWFAFSVPPLNSPASPWASICSLALLGYSIVEFDNVLSGYLCDTYASRTASALAPLSFLRATLSGTFPLFGSAMFHNLGANYAVFVLAGIATAFCAVAVLFGVYGKRIRESSPLAERTAGMGG